MLKRTGTRDPEGIWHCSAADRNKGPITDVLARVLPAHGTAVEIASGTGQHIVHFAHAFPGLHWQPTEPDTELHASIAARTRQAGLANVGDVMALDVREVPWPINAAEALIAINLLHVAPWAVTGALFQGAGRLLSRRGVIVIYGPFHRHGRATSDGNQAFDRQLRDTHPEWGIRDVEAVDAAGADHGFALAELVAMPANNLCLVFEPGTAS